MSRSVCAIFSKRCAYCLALSFLLLKIPPIVNLPAPSLEFSVRSSASFLIAAYFLTSQDSFSPIAEMRAPRLIISPLTQFLMYLNGLVRSFDRSSSLFFKFTLVSPAINLTYRVLSPSVTVDFSCDSSYF
jgi:hypothetical protein